MPNNIIYYKNSYQNNNRNNNQNNNNLEYIFYQNAAKSYPAHTHANHVTLGYIFAGKVRIICGGKDCIYYAGEYFYIMPDTPHAVETVNASVYSMISICLPTDELFHEPQNEISYSKRLKQLISNAPETAFLIEDMAQSIGISPYHMIRQFKSVCGLTPHQFQIQCRVRKAQRLLEEGKSVTEVAYATGFCDQSHFDRCFRKIVRMTPSEYKQSVKLGY